MNENFFEEKILSNYLLIYVLIIIVMISSLGLINFLTCP